MSAINGDKARFHRARKHRIEQRTRNRELVKKLAPSPGKTAAQPKAVTS